MLTSEENKDQKAEDMQKITVFPKELEFHIDLELLMLIERKLSSNRCRVHITDKISTIVEPAQKLHGSSLLAIYQGQRLNTDKTFVEEHVDNNSKIFLNGVQGDMNLMQMKIRWWQRISKIQPNDSWSVSKTSYDALHVMVSKRVTIWGVGVYEPYPDGGDFTLFYRWEIKDMENNIVFSSEK